MVTFCGVGLFELHCLSYACYACYTTQCRKIDYVGLMPAIISQYFMKLRQRLRVHPLWLLYSSLHAVSQQAPSPVILLQATYGGKVTGEATLAVNSNGKATVHFQDFEVTSAKYALKQGDFTYEPSYNFVSQAPALAVSTTRGKVNPALACSECCELTGILWGWHPSASYCCHGLLLLA
jgi:hypothetical protein